MKRLKHAIYTADFHLISAKGIDEAGQSLIFFDFDEVVIDHELKNDIAAAAFRQRFIKLNLNEDAPPESVVTELTALFHNNGSGLMQ